MSFTRTEEIAAVTPGEFRVAFKSSDTSQPPWIKIFRCGETGPAELPNDIERANGYQMGGRFVPADLHGGVEWENVYVAGGTTSTTKYKAESSERVTVPAGTYDAMRVGYVRTDRVGDTTQMTVEGTLWFAPGVGVVREQFKQTNNVGGQSSQGETIEELVAFERGGT